MWPPTLDDLKRDQGDAVTSRDEQSLQMQLDAAVAFVERRHEGRYDFDGNELSELPAPGDDIILGTLRLAYRWFDRRRSPDGLIDSGDAGTNRVPSIDPDIARQLRIGRFSPMEFA